MKKKEEILLPQLTPEMIKQQKQIEFLQECWYKRKFKRQKSTFVNAGIEFFERNDVFIGNFKLTESYFGTYELELIDKSMDLANRPIFENKALFTYLKSMYLQKDYEVEVEELKPYNFNSELTSLQIGNLLLSATNYVDRYKISLVDKEKGIDNKYIDERIDFKKIVKILQKFKLTKKEYDKYNEVKINEMLEAHFRLFCENAHKSSGKLNGYYDLELGNSEFVIEIKLASQMDSKGNKDRASGQIKRYLTEFKKNTFLLLIIGTDNEKNQKNVIELEKEILNDYKCFYYYLEIED